MTAKEKAMEIYYIQISKIKKYNKIRHFKISEITLDLWAKDYSHYYVWRLLKDTQKYDGIFSDYWRQVKSEIEKI